MVNQKSLLEIALEVMNETSGPINVKELIEKALERKGITEDPDFTYAAKLYTDIVISSKFVYMGDEMWDLKSRQPLEQFDKDGSAFAIKDAKDAKYDDEDDDDLDDKNIDLDDEDSYDDEDESDDDDYEDDLDDEDDYDDDDDSYDDNGIDEDKYNEIMDDYEDLYEN